MRNVVTALLSLSCLLLAGCWGKSTPSPSPAPPAVGVSTVTQQNVPIYGSWVASLDGYVNANIQPQVTGYLVKQDCREGSLVRKGDILFEIDARPFQALLDHAKGQLAQTRGQLGQAEAQLGLAQINLKRDRPLAAAHAIAQSQLDNDIQSQKQNEALIRADRASIEAAEASVEQAELNLGYTKVRSLVNGIVGIAMTQVGNLVSPTTVLTTVSQVNPIKVYFAISEQEYLTLANRIRTKSSSSTVDLLRANSSIPIQLTLANDKVYEHPGRILFADRSVDNQTGTIRIIGAFPNPGNILRPGQFARIRALTAMNQNALLVPQQAVTEVQGRYQVAVLQPDNAIRIVNVQVGDRYQDLWIVAGGLKPGDRVVSEGTSKIRDGERVNPQATQTKPVSPYGLQGEEQ